MDLSNSLLLFLIVFLATLASQMSVVVFGFIVEYYRLRKNKQKFQEISKKFAEEMSKIKPKDK
tara:strand:+ start:4320 stop:4508 length:189 start_codon:yes stop_codon:yes gene_type:complete